MSRPCAGPKCRKTHRAPGRVGVLRKECRAGLACAWRVRARPGAVPVRPAGYAATRAGGMVGAWHGGGAVHPWAWARPAALRDRARSRARTCWRCTEVWTGRRRRRRGQTAARSGSWGFDPNEFEPRGVGPGELEPGAFGPGNLRCASVARRLGPGDWSKARAGAVALGPGAGAAAAPVTPAGGRSQTIAMSQNSAEVLRTPRPK